MSCNPIIPPSQDDMQDVLDDTNVGDEQIHEGFGGVETNNDEAEDLDTSPYVIIGTRKVQGSKIAKKPRVGTSLVIQEKISKIAESAQSFTSRKLGEVTVTQVMEAVVECGAACGSNEHYIATSLFVSKDAREMFMTFPTNEIRFNWLMRKYNDAYGN
ncbi:unnamed protein product [Urochloa humidicola]